MKKHLIALDLDGTLLKDDKTISTKTWKVIQQAKQAGHTIAIATGRPYRASKMYYQQLGLSTPIVNFNGAYVHHPADRSFRSFHEPLDLDLARTVIETCRTLNVQNMLAEVLDDVYMDEHDESFIDLLAFQGPVTGAGRLERVLPNSPTSLLVYPQEGTVERLQDLLSSSEAQGMHQRSWGEPHHMIEIIKKGNHKANGLEKVAAYAGLTMEDVIAFGDEDNDLEMLEAAGTGLAMGNASTDTKSVANEVIGTNEEDGIAHYLEERLKLSAYDPVLFKN